MVVRARSRGNTGFTLIELLVVVAIIVVISAVVLTDNNRFGGVVLLNNLAYDVALSVRQAQVYGIAVSRTSTGSFNAGYGVHFDTANPADYILFADSINANGVLDCSSPTNCETVSDTQIQRGFKIVKLCAPEGTDASSCNAVDQLDIVFIRPEPDAYISDNNAATFNAGISNGTSDASARIVLESPRGDIKSVIVENSGQISVQ